MQLLVNEEENKVLVKLDNKYYDVTRDADLISVTLLTRNIMQELGDVNEIDELDSVMEEALRRGIKSGAISEYHATRQIAEG